MPAWIVLNLIPVKNCFFHNEYQTWHTPNVHVHVVHQMNNNIQPRLVYLYLRNYKTTSFYEFENYLFIY